MTERSRQKLLIFICANYYPIDYTGNVHVVMYNHSKDEFEGKRGMKIAQLICIKIAYPEMVEVSSIRKTERGSSGFGSSGIY